MYEQHELPLIDLSREAIDIGAAGLLSEALARRYGAIPIRFLADGAVLVAVNDPTNVVAADDLRLALGATAPGGRRLRRSDRERDHADLLR